jgi:hypothetical protein
MPYMKRRHFLQFSASALAAMGLSQTNFLRQANHYGKALAQSNPRKLALLVGVNAYPEDIPSLNGCLTDVRMQYELLVHRFGFNPADIVIISDPTEELPAERMMGTPTRENILMAFEEHLIKQAREGDVVVFHYSGHGSQILDPKPVPDFAPYNGTMMPFDARNPANPTGGARDIMGKTLFLLTSALKTDNVTTVLDSCHSGGGTRGGLVYRAVDSRYGSGDAEPHEEELAYQEKWMADLDFTADTLLESRMAGVAKGIAIGSAEKEQWAADAAFGSGENLFFAGAFTYVLTRYLWQQSGSQPIDSVFTKLSLSTRDVANDSQVAQDPIYEVSPSCAECNRKPVYFLSPSTPSAEAVVTKAGDEVQFWMGGISSRSLDAFTPGAIFNLVNASGETVGTIEQTGRQGLVGTGILKDGQPAAEGMFLREKIRGVPDNPMLRVALDPSLGDAASEAQTALATVDRVEVVPLDGSTEFDFIFGAMGDDARQQGTRTGLTNLPPDGSFCLFSPGPIPVNDSWNPDLTPETVVEAVARLTPRFKMLLAGRLLKYVLNTDTSNVKVDAKVIPVNGRGVIGSFGSRGATDAGLVTQTLSASTQTLTAGTQVQVEIANDEIEAERGLYMAVLVVGSSGDLNILHPLSPDAAEADALVSPGQTLVVPGDNGPTLTVQGPSGFFELLVLASTEPLRDALKALEQVAARGDGNRFYSLEADEAVNVMELLLGDLDRSSRGSLGYAGDARGVDTTKLAAISAVFQVVE